MGEYAEIGVRLRQYRKSLGLNQLAFAKLLSISKTAVGSLEIGKHGFTSKVLVSLLTKTDIDLEWLLTGERSDSDDRIIQMRTVQLLNRVIAGMLSDECVNIKTKRQGSKLRIEIEVDFKKRKRSD